MKIYIFPAFFCLLLTTKSFAWNSNEVNFNISSINAAKEKAIKENKLLIIEFSAKWCLPCKYMEKTVFRNEDVQKFSAQHAIIFQVDIDENKNLKEEFNIESLPTIIIMKASGQILSRKEESLNAEGFMNWIETNRSSVPEAENTVTKEQFEETPVQVELPNLETREFENALAQNNITDVALKGNSLTTKEVNFHLQTGVFSDRSNAENMVALLGINFQEEIKIVEEHTGQNNLYKVWVGNFKSKEEAELYRKVLDKYKVKSVIKHN